MHLFSFKLSRECDGQGTTDGRPSRRREQDMGRHAAPHFPRYPRYGWLLILNINTSLYHLDDDNLCITGLI